MSWFDKGQKDAQQGNGQQDTSKMTWQEKEKYDAGHHSGKKN
jgi:hypothetical protein